MNPVIRSLASIKLIDDVFKHPNADALDIVRICGWLCVCKRDEFAKNDKCVYIEIDSIIPDDATWLPDGFKKSVSKVGNNIIKSTRIRGQLSQGLAVHLKYFKNIIIDDIDLSSLNSDQYLGYDLTNILNITKQDDMQILNDTYGDFPNDIIPTTDAYRIQQKPELINIVLTQQFKMTMKIDGTSATYYIDSCGKLICCSRNKKTNNALYVDIAHKYDLHNKMLIYPFIALQGEIYGKGVQNNYLNIVDKKIMFFSAYNIIEKRYLNFDEFNLLMIELDLPTVPIIKYDIEKINKLLMDYNQNQDNMILLNYLLDLANQKYPNTKNPMEGIVLSTFDDAIKLKIINNNYLCK